MKSRMIVSSMAVLLAAYCLVVPASAQQDKSKRPSPPAKAECKFSTGKTVTVDYSSPRMKGRKVFGDLVPWDKVWRAGANEATTFVTDSDVVVGTLAVPAGSYTLFTIPTAQKWTLIVSKKTGEWGIPYPGEAQDFGRADMKVASIPAPLENFTIGFDQKGGGCTLHMDWETTKASVEIKQKK